jgi:hypothetical protein
MITIRKKTTLNTAIARPRFDDQLDEVIDAPQRLPASAAMKTAASLKPGIGMMEAAAFGQPEACAIRDAWAFSHPVRKVTRAEFAAMVERQGSVTFCA